MEIKEAIAFLDDLMIHNNFSFSSRTECLYQNKEKIETMQNIFDLRTSEDFTYLYAVSNLLSDNPKAVNDFLLYENKDSNLINMIRVPNRKDLLLVATAMKENPRFFSMAYYWVGIVEDRIAESRPLKNNNIIHLFNNENDFFNTLSIDVDYFISATAAGTPGFNELQKISIESLGELTIEGDSESNDLLFSLKLNPENVTLTFELTIELKTDNKTEKAIVTKDSSKPKEEKFCCINSIDFSKGLKITKISWKKI